MPSASRILVMPSVFLIASCDFCQGKNALNARWFSSGSILLFAERPDEARRSLTRKISVSDPAADCAAALLQNTPPQRYNTMQAATLVALLIPVVAIWITVVVRYGRSIEEIVVATTIEKEE